ncbi:RDD family protein [Neobacillus massiliamazoniensis]|uniref:RDD family protein n=1 Tax=Neobacillus massiliamazoniensis TaxID=1499688 RepID=A0A0U1NW98_9BACI|nr:RDD family protein [Neobacillus massiliamazoniensis]CRK82265.1 RDD family protein [Neobacillus massiliamazoniensis]
MIEKKLASNQKLGANYASIKKRVLASIIDYVVIISYIAILLGGALLIYQFIKIPTGRLNGELISFFTLIFPVFLYLVLTESGKKRATFGKQKMNIYIETNGENQLTLFQVIIKNFIKLLPWQMAHTFIYAGIYSDWNLSTFMSIGSVTIIYGLPIVSILFLCFRKDHRSLHDLIANTIVLERNPTM